MHTKFCETVLLTLKLRLCNIYIYNFMNNTNEKFENGRYTPVSSVMNIGEK